MPKGGRLTIQTKSSVLDGEFGVRCGTPVPPGRYSSLTVKDTGYGMEPATLARISEPFFTTTPVGRGSGLGLAMVYGVARQGSGFVWAESEPGQGTVIRVHWPEMKEAQ
jgi:signal transduction histidine kinase